MTANEDMDEKTDIFDLCPKSVNTSQMAMASEQTCHHQVRDSRWSHHEDYDTYTAVWMHTTSETCKGGNTVKSILTLDTDTKNFWTTSGYGRTTWRS
jgi:hypothetical protein